MKLDTPNIKLDEGMRMLLMEAMAQYPSQSSNPQYDQSAYPDDYCKVILDAVFLYPSQKLHVLSFSRKKPRVTLCRYSSFFFQVFPASAQRELYAFITRLEEPMALPLITRECSFLLDFTNQF